MIILISTSVWPHFAKKWGSGQASSMRIAALRTLWAGGRNLAHLHVESSRCDFFRVICQARQVCLDSARTKTVSSSTSHGPFMDRSAESIGPDTGDTSQEMGQVSHSLGRPQCHETVSAACRVLSASRGVARLLRLGSVPYAAYHWLDTQWEYIG